METKNCITCKEDKPLDQFSKCSRLPDGKQPSCKECNKITNAKFREKRPKYQTNYYQNNPQGRRNMIDATQRYYDAEGGGIYLLINKENGKVYVGQTSQYNRRKNEWNTYPTNPVKWGRFLNKELYDDCVHYGPDAFEWKILERMPDSTLKQRRERENFYIDVFSLTNRLYNKIKNR
jgi:hypothetical protein